MGLTGTPIPAILHAWTTTPPNYDAQDEFDNQFDRVTDKELAEEAEWWNHIMRTHYNMRKEI